VGYLYRRAKIEEIYVCCCYCGDDQGSLLHVSPTNQLADSPVQLAVTILDPCYIELHFRITPHTAETRGTITTIHPRHLYCSYQRDGVWQTRGQKVLRSTHKSPAADVIPTFVRNTELSLNHFRRDLKTVYFRLPTWSGELVTFLGYTRARTSNLRTELTWRAWLVGEMSSYSSSALQRTVLWWTVETTAGREGGDGGATTAAWLRRMAAAVWCQRIYLVLVVGDEQWLAARGAGSSASVLAQRRLTVSLQTQQYVPLADLGLFWLAAWRSG